MFLDIYPLKDIKELKNERLPMNQLNRIAKSKKEYAVLIEDKLHLVNDLNTLFNDRLRHEQIYNPRIYPLKEL